jgi:hypothetical protein
VPTPGLKVEEPAPVAPRSDAPGVTPQEVQPDICGAADYVSGAGLLKA